MLPARLARNVRRTSSSKIVSVCAFLRAFAQVKRVFRCTPGGIAPVDIVPVSHTIIVFGLLRTAKTDEAFSEPQSGGTDKGTTARHSGVPGNAQS